MDWTTIKLLTNYIKENPSKARTEVLVTDGSATLLCRIDSFIHWIGHPEFKWTGFIFIPELPDKIPQLVGEEYDKALEEWKSRQ